MNEIIQKLNNIESLLNKNNFSHWLTLKEVCQYAKLSTSTIQRAVQKGEIKVSKKTGKNLFKIQWVEQFLNGK